MGSVASERIDARTIVGPIRLTVADLERSLDYYTGAIGLEAIARDGDTAELGAGGKTLLTLDEKSGAVPVRRHTGLFHFALLLPDRASLGRWLLHAAKDGVPVGGASDHTVSEALYLSDPDGHGIEIYRDRPREGWEGEVATLMGTEALDVDGLIAEARDGRGEPYGGMPPNTTMGHVHLQVADIPETIGFYRDVLGFDLTAEYGDSAAFFSAGGYHHHIGTNVWNSKGRPPAPDGSASLRFATILVPDEAELDRVEGRLAAAGSGATRRDATLSVRDPSGIELQFRIAA